MQPFAFGKMYKNLFRKIPLSQADNGIFVQFVYKKLHKS